MFGRLKCVVLLVSVAISVSECKLQRKERALNETDDGKSSLAFVFDVTGSMYNDLRQLREGAEMILKTALEESNVIADFVFVPFHDPKVGPATVTKSKEVFKKALNIVRVYGGGDCPEMSLTGIHLALNVSRPKSFLYVFTDATSIDHRKVGSVLDTIQRKQSQVVFILTGHCNDLDKPTYKVYQQVAAASSGQIFNLNKTSVHKMLEFVKSSIKGRTVNLASVSNPAGYNYTQEIPVDSSLGEVTVSVSGAKPQITVVDPKGEQLTGPPKLITTLDLSEIMVVKVMQPEPGNWTITVGSEEDYSVKVVGLSNLTFNHGFSVETPSSIKETSYRPLKGTYNHMMISLTKTNISAAIQYAEILTLEGKPLFEMPLVEVDAINKVYRADPFIPPDDLFYIAINGRDQNNHELRRVGATAIQAKLPDVPYLTSPRKVEARSHSRVVLSCDVESLVPVNVMWTKDGSRMQKHIAALQTTSIDYLIEDMKEEDVGIYRCVAKNVAGFSKAATELSIIVDPPQVTIEPGNTTVEAGDTVTVSCTVYSEALLLENKLVFNGTDSHYAFDIDKNPNIEGLYTYNKTMQISEKETGLYSCIASNRGGKTNQTARISIKMNPTAQILGPHTLSKSIHSDFQLVCAVENAQQVVWSTPSNSEVKKSDVNGTYSDVLEVRDVADDDVWTCTAVRGALKGSDSVTVAVLIKPDVSIQGEKTITVINGTVVQVTCVVTAKPSPRILWHRETEKFLNNTITEIKPSVYQSVLTLNSSAEDVGGTYFCFGENAEGINQDSVNVSVRRKMTLVKGFDDQSVQLYYQIELQCIIDAYPPAVIQWHHNGTSLVLNDNVHLTEDNTTVYFKRVDFSDLGEYRCVGGNGFEKVEAIGSVRVDGLAAPMISKEAGNITAREKEPAVIPCRILQGSPEPTIIWQYKRDEHAEFSSPPKDVVVDCERFELKIPAVTEGHRGVYRCVAGNVIGQDIYDVTLVVQYPPKLLQSLKVDEKPLEVKLGERLKLPCEASGMPPPVTVWTKDGKPITFTDNLSVTETSELEIKEASTYNSGTYTCNVTSAVGSTHKNFTVIVYDPPSITPPLDPTLEMLEGQLVELPCKARGSPTPDVEWTFNGSPISDRKNVDEYGLRFVANLTDFGEYTCKAKNMYGNVSITYTLHVWVQPFIIPPSKVSHEVLLGANATMQCDVIGFPIPAITWKFDGNTLTENTTDVSFNDVGNIYIHNASSKHEGEYVCVAENVGGIAEQPFFLVVNELPKIMADNYTGPYLATNVDTVLSIPCISTGKPKPYVMWAKDEFYLNKDPRYTIDSDGTLLILSPSEDLSGQYTCVAKSHVGDANRTVTVEIYSLPAPAQSEESMTSVTLLEGTDAAVDCPVRATAHSIKWYKDAKLIATGPLSFPNVSRDNSSSYSCVVTNAVGSAHATIQLIVEWAPKLEEGDSYVEAVRGDDAFLHCDADAKPGAKTKWVFNSKPLAFEDKSSLKLINAQLHNAGTYKCIVSNVHGTVVKEFTLRVLEPPFISEFDVMDVQLKEGDNATLECNAKGTPKPNVTWTYNNTHWQIDKTSLSATNITSEHEGMYRCDAKNKAGATYIVYRVSVVFAAAIQDIVAYTDGQGYDVTSVVEVVQGTNIRIACTASGNPIPDIQWLKQGRELSENRYDIDYADLLLKDVDPGQAGIYTCVASNEGGTDNRKIKLEVLEPPKIFQSLFDPTNTTKEHIEVILGQSFYLHCHPYGNPLPEVYWFKNDVPLRLFDDTMLSTEFGEVIVVKKALEEQSGMYMCVARNKVGNTSITYQVDVLVPPPTPKESTKKVVARFGKPLTLACPELGTRPDVMWIKHPYTEISAGDRIMITEDRFTLVIHKTEVSDSGKYSCILTNKVGTTEVTFDVIVHKAPSIAGNVGANVVEDHVVPMRRSIVLKCEADGHPQPIITWLKDTQQLSESVSNIQRVLGNSLLAVWSVAARDAGQYICLAESKAGTAHRRYNVAVQVPAKWSGWSSWSLCNVTCGLGHQSRARICHYTDEQNNTIDSSTQSEKIILDMSACKGNAEDKRKCHMPPCEVDEWKPRWSQWSHWSECSAPCGSATQARTRRCRSKAPCDGDNVQIRKCTDLPLCNPGIHTSDDDSKQDSSDANPYSPEMTFEMEPEEINSHYSPDIEQFYSASDTDSSPVFFDVEVTENLDGSEKGPCDPGYTYRESNNTCDDVDECTVVTNQCHMTQVCVNIEGGYRCSCSPGYLALGAGQRCMDINECELDTDGCEYSCVNTAGGYVCACPKHLRLHLDKHHCVIPSLYRRPYGEGEAEYLSTTIDLPSKYSPKGGR